MMIKCCLLLLQHIFNQLHLSKWICPVEKKKKQDYAAQSVSSVNVMKCLIDQF